MQGAGYRILDGRRGAALWGVIGKKWGVEMCAKRAASAVWRLGDRLWSQVVKIYGLEGVTYFIFVFV